MNCKYFLTFIIICIASVCFSQNTDTTINCVELRIERRYPYVASIWGKLCIINRDLFFKTKKKKNFVKKDIKIYIDSIAYIADVTSYLLEIVTKDSCKYRFGLNGRREFLKKIKNLKEGKLKIIIGKYINYNTYTKKGIAKVKIPFPGSTFYTPIWASIDIENNVENIILKPTEYTCILQPVYINKKEIKEIRKKKNNKWIIVLQSGLKFRIIANSGEKLFEDN